MGLNLLPNHKEKKKDENMTLTGHLSELRNRIAVGIAVFMVAFVVCFTFIRTIADYMLNLGLASGFHFVYLNPSELLTSYLKLSLIVALVVAAPVILFEVWLFIAPALEDRERKSSRIALVVGFVFFAVGVVFAYMVALPFMVQFLVNFNTSTFIASSISVENYLNFVVSIVMTFGLIFEMPILALLLSVIGILKPDFMRKIRKYAILLIFIIAAIITPPDVVSQVMIAVPMLFLYELSILISAVVAKQKAAREAAEEAQDYDDEDGCDDDDAEERM